MGDAPKRSEAEYELDMAGLHLAEFMCCCVHLGDALPDDLRAVMLLIEQRQIVDPEGYS